MPRIAGIDIPNDKNIIIALRYVYGIGPKIAESILAAVNIPGDLKARELSEEDVTRLNSEIESNHVVEGQLRRQVITNIQRLKDIRSYRGLRHIRGLPVRGQQTQANARTRKGPRQTVANKKK
ncbi:MAG: 30S ribosomal protein S13 [Planctomycetota bacterium]